MARSAQSIDIGMEGATDAIYFTHDYFTMSSDKNTHLQLVSKLAKKHGVSNFTAVCPMEHDLAWAEDNNCFYKQAREAEQAAFDINNDMTVLRTNLVFGPESHLIHFLS